MTQITLTDEQIADLLVEPLPSDYDTDTDIEAEEEEFDETPTVTVSDKLMEDGQCIELDESCVITVHENEANEQADVNEKKATSKRKWRKKEEKEADTDFPRDSVRDSHVIFNPLEAFKLFFDDAMLNHICYQTNLYSVQKNKPLNLTKEELMVFLGINIVMGYNRLNTISSYWASGNDLGNAAVAQSMSRDRFFTILRYLHLNDNSKIPTEKRDKIFKLRPLIEDLNEKFFNVHQPDEYLAIDESMIKFKGRSSLKQYNPMKPIKRGFKLWCLASGSGYVHRFELYTGKNEEQKHRELGLGGSIVMNFAELLQKKNHKIFFDNFFSSIPLLEALKVRKVLGCGTIRPSRKDFPVLEHEKKLNRGDFDFRSLPNGITVFRWKDSKAVNFISNYHGVDKTTVSRKQQDGRKIEIPCPSVVKDYNNHMGGVDTHDQLRQLNGIHRKNIKWWHRLFFGLVDMSIVNAYIIYKEAENLPLTQFNFRRELAKGLLTFSQKETPWKKRRKTNYSIPTSVRLTNVGIHMPVFGTTKSRCEVCSKRGVESRPISKCDHCGVNLCCNMNKNCFKEFHS